MAHGTRKETANDPPHPPHDRASDMKKYLFTAIGTRRFIIEAASEEAAHNAICENTPHLGFDWEVDEYRLTEELKTEHAVNRAMVHGAVMADEL